MDNENVAFEIFSKILKFGFFLRSQISNCSNLPGHLYGDCSNVPGHLYGDCEFL